MAEAARTHDDAFVEADLTYMVYTGSKPRSYISPEGTRVTEREGPYETKRVPIRDGRPSIGKTDIEREGFVLVNRPTEVTDFFDTDEVERVYYPETAEIIKQVTGARRVHVFDHTIRVNSDEKRIARKVREPVRLVHNDYTETSGPQRVRDLLPDEADELLKGRFAVVQLWRPINNPVHKTPLAICDAQSIEPKHIHPTDLVYEYRVGEVLQIEYGEGQRWSYFPEMSPDEALVFKCYDSLTDGRARFTAHSAFDDPTAAPDAPERESIEMRALVFY